MGRNGAILSTMEEYMKDSSWEALLESPGQRVGGGKHLAVQVRRGSGMRKAFIKDLRLLVEKSEWE